MSFVRIHTSAPPMVVKTDFGMCLMDASHHLLEPVEANIIARDIMNTSNFCAADIAAYNAEVDRQQAGHREYVLSDQAYD